MKTKQMLIHVLLFKISMDFLLHAFTYDLGHHRAPSMIYNPSY
jgi:hypothetical protein